MLEKVKVMFRGKAPVDGSANRHSMKFLLVPSGAGVMAAASAFPAFAEGGTPAVVGPTDWASVITALTAQISVSTIIGALATFVTAGIGLVFMWWGVRKGLRSLMSAFRSGKMRI